MTLELHSLLLFVQSLQKQREAHQKNFYSLTWCFVRTLVLHGNVTSSVFYSSLCMDVTSLDAKFLLEEKMVPSGTRLWMPNSECELSEVVLVHFSCGDNSSGSHLLVQFFMSAICRSLLMVGKNS